jgi:hypothetical protein
MGLQFCSLIILSFFILHSPFSILHFPISPIPNPPLHLSRFTLHSSRFEPSCNQGVTHSPLLDQFNGVAGQALALTQMEISQVQFQ